MSGKYQTFLPGRYLDWEKPVIEARFEQAEKFNADPSIQGEPRPVPVTEEAVLLENGRWNPYDPLYNDPAYAKNLGLPAVPAYVGTAKGGMSPGVAGIPKDLADGFYYANDGSDYRYYKPIYPGDTLYRRTTRMEFKDQSIPGDVYRRFYLGTASECFNQRGEKVFDCYTNLRQCYQKIIDGSAPPTFSQSQDVWIPTFPEPYYNTDEDWARFCDLWRAEKIRGDEILYWEDVNVGDEPTPTCTAPVNYMDMGWWHGCSVPDWRDAYLNKPAMLREQYVDRFGNYFFNTAVHYGTKNVPGARMLFYNGTAAMHMMRTLTNFIGNHGFVTRFDWKFHQFFPCMRIQAGGEYLNRVPYMRGRCVERHGADGDAVISKAYVTDKYIDDLGRHIIDVTLWGETADGTIIQVVGAGAQLPSREA